MLLCGGRIGSTERGIDLRFDTAHGERRQTRLRLAGLDLVADLEPPFPDVWFGRRLNRVFYALVDHRMSLLPGKGQTFFGSCSNPGDYGSLRGSHQ